MKLALGECDLVAVGLMTGANINRHGQRKVSNLGGNILHNLITKTSFQESH